MKQFWMVWNGQAGTPPVVKQWTQAKAVDEAERLARLHRGTTFFVLEATHAITVDDIHRVHLRPELPF